MAAFPANECFPDEIISLASGGKITLCIGKSLNDIPVLVTPTGGEEPVKHVVIVSSVVGVPVLDVSTEEQGNSNEDSDVVSSLGSYNSCTDGENNSIPDEELVLASF